ncbi:endonuclease/exonuclease/phosphatase family protein [Winogradskyella forsetii]|uniref:endonuclease/exonuclease/phosphatase family protein n=1 Tax=Winogradskyella forsetii TaxID=2686077 RepID=UPI0015BBA454|nr:endonuclease/exonuclease/phosphatase family protein [Winogradskyella forsetii]
MIVIYILSIIFIITPFLPATGFKHWFFRTADFVRLQSIAIEIILLILFFIFEEQYHWFQYVLIAGLLMAIVYQLKKVIPYTKLAKRLDHSSESDGMVSILAANVLQTNSQYDKLIAIINKNNPDLVLTMESNKDWENALTAIEETYPYTVKVPMENLYGMHLYSKNRLKNVSTQFQVEDDVPSIYFDYAINNEVDVFFGCLHPAPPSPTENDTSKEQDAELMLTGKYIRDLDKPCVVCGDMNDVVWSRTTRLFKKMTKMIDPRVGRGMYPTFHASYRLMRFPLDHLFITKDLYVGKMYRTKPFGSDHFGVYYEIYHKKEEQSKTNGKLNGEEKEDVNEKIEEGKEKASENDN